LKSLVVGDFSGGAQDGLAGFASDGSLWYTADMQRWTNIPGQINSLTVGNFNGGAQDGLAGLKADGSIWYTTNMASWTSIPGSLSNLYAAPSDAQGRQDTATSIVGQGQNDLNQLLAMSPYNATTAASLLQQAQASFSQATILNPNNSEANFGLAITTAAVVSQNLINKWAPLLESNSVAGITSMFPGISSSTSSAMIWNTADTIASTNNPLSTVASTYAGTVETLQGITPYQIQNFLGMQADLQSVFIPMLQQVSGCLSITEKDSAFSFQLGSSSGNNYFIILPGDVELFHSALLGLKCALAMPASYNLDPGTFDFSLTMADRADSNGYVPVSAYLPASPCLTLSNATFMQQMHGDLDKACDEAVAGINATLARTSDYHSLIPWHTSSKFSLEKLLLYSYYAQELRQAADGPYTIQFQTVNQVWNDNTYQYDNVVQTFGVKTYLSAWSDNPPTDLKYFAPELQVLQVDYVPGYPEDGTYNKTVVVQGTYNDTTFGGLFPDSLPSSVLYGAGN
jgi:hypothetical protein